MDKEYLVMELLGGEDMAKFRNYIRTNSGPMIPLIPTVYLTGQILKCIAVLHKRGYVHRDIKPSNFVRCKKNSTEFHMVDFGIAKQVRRTYVIHT